MRRGLTGSGVVIACTDVLSRRYFRGDMMYGSAPEPLGMTRRVKETETSARQAVKAAKRRRFAQLRSASASFRPDVAARGAGCCFFFVLFLYNFIPFKIIYNYYKFG